ncbi:MAG: hypothetical protein HYS41_00915 [Candidatus Omnitrophica bacterium]|nr:hypothetical protein [Candidatus Omnitrophota bacterium]
MSRWKIAIAVAVAALGGCWLLARGPSAPPAAREEPPPQTVAEPAPPEPVSQEPAPPAEEAHKVFYLELNEVNRDGFEELLFISDSPAQPPAFRMAGSRILVPEEVAASIAAGTQEKEFRLFLDKPGMDLAKEAKLFLIHAIRYEGKGREGSLANYYVFSQYPAQLALPVYSQRPESLELGLNDSVAKTFSIRLIPSGSLTLAEQTGQDGIEVAFAGKKSVVLSEGEEVLSKLKHATSITQELFAPVPKGEVKPEDLRLVKEEYGRVDFFTEISLKNVGLREVSVETGLEAKPDKTE